jgi:hypothetical protein
LRSEMAMKAESSSRLRSDTLWHQQAAFTGFYTFDVTGIVTADDGSPLKDIDVRLRVDSLVCEGVTCFSTRRLIAFEWDLYFCGSDRRSEQEIRTHHKQVDSKHRSFPETAHQWPTTRFD